MLHPRPYKRTGEKQDGRPILEQDRTGDNFLVFFIKKRGNIGKIPGKNWTGDKKLLLVDGRERNIARPFIREGVYIFFIFIHFRIPEIINIELPKRKADIEKEKRLAAKREFAKKLAEIQAMMIPDSDSSDSDR